MGDARLSLGGAEETRVLDRLIVFLTERAEGAGVPVPPGDMCGKVPGTCMHLVDGVGGASEEKAMIVCRTTMVPGGHRLGYLGGGRVEFRRGAEQAEGS